MGLITLPEWLHTCGGDMTTWRVDESLLKADVSTLENAPATVDVHLTDAFMKLEGIVRANQHYASDLDAALKSSNIDADISRALHTQQRSP